MQVQSSTSYQRLSNSEEWDLYYGDDQHPPVPCPSQGQARLDERRDVTTDEQRDAILRIRPVPDLRKSALLGASVKDRRIAFLKKGDTASISTSSTSDLDKASQRRNFPKPVAAIDGRQSAHVASVRPVAHKSAKTTTAPRKDFLSPPGEQYHAPKAHRDPAQSHTAMCVTSLPGEGKDSDNLKENVDGQTFGGNASYEEQLKEARRRYGKPKVRRTNSTHAHTSLAEKLKAFQQSYNMATH